MKELLVDSLLFAGRIKQHLLASSGIAACHHKLDYSCHTDDCLRESEIENTNECYE